jgi:plastocyanin
MRVRRPCLTIALVLAGSIAVAPAGAGASPSSNPSAASPSPSPGPGAVPPPSGTVASPAPPPVPVVVRALPADPRVGQQVRLLALGSPAATTGYRWDLAGRGAVELAGAATPRAAAIFTTAGAHTVTVRVTSAEGVEVGTLVVDVRPATSSRPEPSGAVFVPDAQRPAPAPDLSPRPSIRSSTRSSSTKPRPVAHIAGDPSVTIADFHFTPGATTVHVGDSITWTNAGPSSHSATASDGSFDTGVLSKGQSGSHTFTKAGTFSYFCKIHPFMHGTIVVLAKTGTAATPPAGAGSSSAPSAPSPAQSQAPGSAQTAGRTPADSGALAAGSNQASSAPALPVTGLDLGRAVATGLLLIGAGMTLRRGLRHRL